MSSIKHWPGKLSAHGPDKYGDIKLCGQTSNGLWVAFANYYKGEPAVTHDDGSPMSRADWLNLMEGTNERIAACWNALAGIDDEHLPTIMQEVREVLGVAIGSLDEAIAMLEQVPETIMPGLRVDPWGALHDMKLSRSAANLLLSKLPTPATPKAD